MGARNQILCGVFDDFEDRKGKKKRRAFAKAPLSRSAVDDDIFGKIDGYYINTGCMTLSFSLTRAFSFSFSLSKGKKETIKLA